MARIALVRHGRSAHEGSGWIDVEGFRAWHRAYGAAGIREDEAAPITVVALAARADLLVASDTPRALASARLLAGDREVVASPELRELELQPPDLGRLRLPFRSWALAVGARNTILTLRGRFPSQADAERARRAAAWLDELATPHDLVLAVTHGGFRPYLGTALRRIGWRAEPGRLSVASWSTRLLRRP